MRIDFLTILTGIVLFSINASDSHKLEGVKQLNVHIVPHSHMKVGGKDSAKNQQTKYADKIFSQVIQELILSPEKTFTCSDMFFFKSWWEKQDAVTQQKVRLLIHDKRFEIVNGGWVQADEACPSYNAILDNMYVGHKFLHDSLGYLPRIAWQVDSFGHSSVNAKLFSEMGFEALLIGQINEEEKIKRVHSQSMEFLWQPKFSQEAEPSKDQIFVSLLFNGYKSPIFRLPNENQTKFQLTDKQVALFISYLQSIRLSYKSSHVLIPMGEDFSFVNLVADYGLIDQLIQKVPLLDPTMNIFYSTVQNYVDQVKSDLKSRNFNLDVYKADFLPLMSHQDQYWSGYFSSRPEFKRLQRIQEQQTQISNQLYSLEMMRDNSKGNVYYNQSQKLMQQQSLTIDHELISGTSMNHVIMDAAAEIEQSIQSNQQMIFEIIKKKASTYGFQVDQLDTCMYEYAKRNPCPFQNLNSKLQSDKDLLFAVYNPSQFNQSVPTLQFSRHDISFEEWDTEASKFEYIYSETACFNNPNDENECDFYLNTTLAPLEYKFFRVKMNYLNIKNQRLAHLMHPSSLYEKFFTIKNKQISLKYLWFNKTTGKLEFVYQDHKHYFMKQISFDYRYYHSVEKDLAGMYIFYTDHWDSYQYDHEMIEGFAYQGALVEQFIFHFSHNKQNHQENTDEHMNYYLKVKLYKDVMFSTQIEFDMFFGRIPKSATGKEVTVNWELNDYVSDYGLFYTAQNDLKLIERKAPYDAQYHIPKSFYPVDSGIMIVEWKTNTSFVVMNDRAMSGSSFRDGRIEMILNRRIYTSDFVGIDSNMDETDLDGKGLNVSAKFFLSIAPSMLKGANDIFHHHSKHSMPPQIYFTENFQIKDGEAQAAKRELISYFQNRLTQKLLEHGIKNLLINPVDSSGNKFNIRLIFDKEGQQVNYNLIAEYLTMHAFSEQPDALTNYNINVIEKHLDGVRKKNEIYVFDQEQSDTDQIQIFELTLAKKKTISSTEFQEQSSSLFLS